MNGPKPSRQFDICVVGAGQLARMMAQAAIPLGIRLRLLAQSANDGAALIWPDVFVGSPDDPNAVAEAASGCAVITFDHELVPNECLDRLKAEGATIRPSASTLRFAQDKRWQREQFTLRGLPIPEFAAVRTAEEIAAFADRGGWPVALKTAHGGYDGRGVWKVSHISEASSILSSLPSPPPDLLVERWIPIDREIAVLVARSPSGQVAVYPVVDTVQIDGICREIVAPAGITNELHERATALAVEVVEVVGLVGVMAVEMFVAGDDILINEIATRPHNSGHYSIEGCATSQFEQHLRAVMDWPLGSTALTAKHVVTINVLGGSNGQDLRVGLAEALAVEGVHVHLYGKEARPGRKLGHVTMLGEDVSELRDRAWQAAEILTGEPAEVLR